MSRVLPHRWPLAGGLIAGLVLLAGRALGAEESAREWLAGMTAALAGDTYQGEFLHVSNGQVEKLRILHRVKDGRVSERLVSLGGSGREVIRNDAEVQCYLPDQHQVLVETHVAHGALLGTLPAFDPALEASYVLAIGGRARSVLGRLARLVTVTPRDGYRFGYRLWIDEQTHMPVRTDLSDAGGTVLEQVLFTELRVGGVLPDAALRPALAADGFVWIRQPPATPGPSLAVPWQIGRMPPGFRIRSTGEELLPGSPRPVTHLVVSDGLASVSVFIEGPPDGPRLATEGRGRLGSEFAYSRVVSGHQVTAIGEVPAATVEYIATGVSAAPLLGLQTRP